MALNTLKEAVGLLIRMPLLWIPGIVGGAFAAIIWLSFFTSGAFFTSRLIVIFALVLLFFTTGMLSAIRNNETTGRSLVTGAVSNFFRVLLPQIVIGFLVMLVFFICTIIFTLVGLGTDIGLLTALTFGITIPTLMLTFFFDTAAVFEDRRVFESIQRSILVVSEHMMETLAFYLVSAVVCAGIIFGLMMAWEAILFEKLKPIMDFTEEEIAAFTPEQLMAMIGQDGIWVTAAVIFIGILILLPLMYSYKACFYRKMAGSTPSIGQNTGGEYDSKGRWYKY